MNCSGMKLGQIYICGNCGLELKVVKECDCEGEICSCSDLECCGGGLKPKA